MHVAFNQDASCVVLASPQGFRVYNCSPFGRFYNSEDSLGPRDVGLAEMLFSTSLVVITGGGEADSPRRLAVINTRKSQEAAKICELFFSRSVRAVQLNRQRLVVVMDTEIAIYNIANMKLLHTLETVANRLAVASITPTAGIGKRSAASGESPVTAEDLASSATGNWLAYPAGPPLKHHVSPPAGAGQAPLAPQGDVVIFDLDTLSPVTVIRAHRSPLIKVELNEDGTLLATTSNRGTLVRVFAVPSGTLLYEFRRGSYHTRVYSLAFSLGSKLLCVSSATQTVHIYRLDASQRVKHSNHTAGLQSEDEEGLHEGDTSAGLDLPQEGSEAFERDEHNRSTGNGADQRSVSPGGDSEADLADSLAKTQPEKEKNKSKKHSSWFSRSSWTGAARSHRVSLGARDFAWFKLPLKPDIRTEIGLIPLSNLICVATNDGRLFHFAIDMEKGGECKKVAEYFLD